MTKTETITSTTAAEPVQRGTGTGTGVEGPETGAAVLETPSGNISCPMVVSESGSELRCHIRETAGPDLPKPASEEGCDWAGGRNFTLGPTGEGRRHAPCDAVPADERITLEYGNGWVLGPYTCLSSVVGLLCTNESGNGLFLSRERQETF